MNKILINISMLLEAYFKTSQNSIKKFCIKIRHSFYFFEIHFG